MMEFGMNQFGKLVGDVIGRYFGKLAHGQEKI